MDNPLRLLELLSTNADKLFIWTHYYDYEIISKRSDSTLFSHIVSINDNIFGSKRAYPESALNWSGFSGGKESYAFWLDRQSLINFLTDKGYSITIGFDQPDHVNGPAMAICARRKT